MSLPSSLIADIGGTNARFRLVRDGAPETSLLLPVAEFDDSLGLIRCAMDRLSCARLDHIRIALAGRIAGNRVALTNGTLVFDAAALAGALGGSTIVTLYNDLQAAALGLPWLGADDSLPLGGGPAGPDRTQSLALVSVGTGLGISCYLPGENGGRSLATEGGHATLPTTTPEERKIAEAFEKRFGRVSSERVLSGSGLGILYEVMTGSDSLSPGRIVDGALAGDRDAHEVLTQFCAFLGGVAGDMALIYGAWGGVFIGGGVAPRFAGFLAASPFRERFEAKGRFREALRQTPARLVLRDDLALIGLASQTAGALDGGAVRPDC